MAFIDTPLDSLLPPVSGLRTRSAVLAGVRSNVSLRISFSFHRAVGFRVANDRLFTSIRHSLVGLSDEFFRSFLAREPLLLFRSPLSFKRSGKATDPPLDSECRPSTSFKTTVPRKEFPFVIVLLSLLFEFAVPKYFLVSL